MTTNVEMKTANYSSDSKPQFTTTTDVEIENGVVGEIIETRRIQQKFGMLRKARELEELMDRKLGVESQGIDRIPDEERSPPSIWNIFFLWFSMTCHVGTIPLGMLGAEFGLSLGQSVAAIVVGLGLGILCPAFTGQLGPKLGLRAIASSRYSFGFWGAKLCSVLNIVIDGGFAVVNVVVVGQVLSAVSDFHLSITVGIVIISILSYIVSIFGYSVIHTFEKYFWIISFILMLVLVGQTAPYVVPSAPGGDTGLTAAGSFLSFLAINFSNGSGWCSMAADYYVNYPSKTKGWKIFALTWFGLLIPAAFTTIVGALLGNAAITAAYPPYSDAYSAGGLGGLLLIAFHPLGWSKFCLVMFAFSVLGNNVPVLYSMGLSVQLLGDFFHAVPRFIWSLVATIVIAVLGIAGKEHLSDVISDFVSMLGYWTISFTLILLIEDKWFRRTDGYNLAAWDTPAQLPWGVAAVTSLLIGYCAGGVPGMQQTWFTGPIAAKIGDYGGDVGIYLSGIFTLVVYPVARTLEKRYTGR